MSAGRRTEPSVRSSSPAAPEPPSGGGERNVLPGRFRVKARADYLEAQQRGRKIHTPHFVVSVLRRQGPERPVEARLGITVTKRIAGAVGRNRVKRVVREVFRCNRSMFPPSSDVVVIAKDGAPLLSLAEAQEELLSALSQLQGASQGDSRKRRGPRSGGA